MKVVLDCNVLIAAGITNGTCRHVVTVVVREHEWYLSEPTVDEFLAVNQRAPLRRYRPRFQAIYQALSSVAISVQPDPDDVVYLQTDIAAQADVLVTGNQKDFLVDQHQRVRSAGVGSLQRYAYVSVSGLRLLCEWRLFQSIEPCGQRLNGPLLLQGV